MKDDEIITLFFKRDEAALIKTQEKYEAYMKAVAYSITDSVQDSEECVNTALNSLWNSIPPNKPQSLKAYIAKVVRNKAFERCVYNSAKKRSFGYTEPLDELDYCISGSSDIQREIEIKELSDFVNSFLRTLPKMKRMVFVRRYFYCNSIKQISQMFDISESKVKSMLFQLRAKLRTFLKKNGLI